MTLSERNTFFKAGIISCAVCVIFIITVSFFTIPLYSKKSGQSSAEESKPKLNSDSALSHDEEIINNHNRDFHSISDYHSFDDIHNSLIDGRGLSVSEDLKLSTDKNSILSPFDVAVRRPYNFLHRIINRIAGNNYYAVNISLFLLAAFSLTGMILIYYYFERTSTPEILFIAFFTVSCSFEVIRIIIPLHLAFHFPLVYIITAKRILLFTRFFGIFALFAAGICSTGLEIQRMRNTILIITIAAMILTMGFPIDVLSWDTSFNTVNGYSTMFRMIELVVFITIIASFLITAKNKDSKEYVYAAAGIMIALIGRNFLLNTDNWAGSILGIIMLSFGMWMLCSKLHKIYLWL